MGQHTVVSISHDRLRSLECDPMLGARLSTAVTDRRYPNKPTFPDGVLHGTQLGPRFSSAATMFVRIENGAITELSIAELIALETCLERFRKKQAKQLTLQTKN